jgi:choline dehydrogenase-like flavoprotein
MTKTYDAIVIGTGRAGPFLAQRLAGAGMNVGVRAVAPRMPCI